MKAHPRLFTTAIAVIIFLNAFTQTIQWQKALGGTADDMVLSIRQTADEGFIVGGVTASKDGDIAQSKGKGDLWVAKLDKTGVITWKKTLGGPNEEQGCIALPTTDGGYLIAGNTSSNSGDVRGYHGGVTDIWGSSGYDIWIVKLNDKGVIQWQRCLGGSKIDELFTVKEMANGYLVAGNTNSSDGDVAGHKGDFDIWLVNLSTSGTLLSQRTLGGPGTEKIRDLQIQNGQIYFAGYTTANGGDISGFHGNTDIWVGRASLSGDLLWQKSLGGSNRESDFSNFIRPTADGGFLVAGYTTSNDGDVSNISNYQSAWVVKFSINDAIEWQTEFADSDGVGAFHRGENGSSVFNVTYYETVGTQRIAKPFIIKLAPDGSIEWSKPTHSIHYLIDAAQDGGYIIFGSTAAASVPGYHQGRDAWMSRLDGQGNTLWEKAYGGSNNDFLQGRTAVYTGNTFPISTAVNAPWSNYIPTVATTDGGYYFAVSTGSNNGDVTGFHYNSKVGNRFDMWVVKLSASATQSAKIVRRGVEPNKIFKHSIYPNPTRYSTTLQFTPVENGDVAIEIYSIAGAKLQTIVVENVSAGITVQRNINLYNFPAGEYIYMLNQGTGKQSGIINKAN